MSAAIPHPFLGLFEREIRRFRFYARKRSDSDRLVMRRKHRRCHRSWPLLVGTFQDGILHEFSAALHDASEGGIGFMSDQALNVGCLVYIKLFWHEANALRIPSLVRHVTSSPNGILVGTEFAIEDTDACEIALRMESAI